jgi:hypothetical protein
MLPHSSKFNVPALLGNNLTANKIFYYETFFNYPISIFISN